MFVRGTGQGSHKRGHLEGATRDLSGTEVLLWWPLVRALAVVVAPSRGDRRHKTRLMLKLTFEVGIAFASEGPQI